MKAHICHITSVHPRYDIRIFVKECNALAVNDYQTSLIVSDNLNDEIKDGVSIYGVKKTNSRLFRAFNSSIAIYKKIKNIHPDYVHLHDPELLFLGLYLSIFSKCRVVYDVHEDLPKQIMNKHWINKLIRPLIAKVANFIELSVAKRIYGVVCATNQIAKRFEVVNKNTIVLYNYPKLSELLTDETNWELRSNYLCYIGSISKTRGILELVESLQVSKIRLKLAGKFSGDVNLEMIDKLDTNKLVDYLGILDREEIKVLLNQVKIGIVTLLPTPSYVESLPIKLFEYMLAGIPVIASNFPLWMEIINDAKCGVCVDPENSNAIANATHELLNNQNLAFEMGQNGRMAVIEKYNWEKEVSKFIAFYSNV